MKNKIKSPFIIEKVFSYLDERRKLEIVRYNKAIQKNLNINLINYRLFVGKYIIESKNGICKIYDYNDNLLFEGEYLNGKRNGHGKEYNKFGKLLFEGEYLNGKKWNGKAYYSEFFKDNQYLGERIEIDKFNYRIDNCKIYYELKDGKGYMRDYDDEESIYEGEYLNGERNGKGREFRKFGDSFIVFYGEYLNGKRNGKGKEYLQKDENLYDIYIDKLIFEGEYLNGKRWNGKQYNGNNETVYEIKDGKGYIKQKFDYKFIFEGEYLNGEINGKGKKYNTNYNSYLEFECEFLNGKKHGNAKEYNKEKILIFEGKYLYNYRIKGKEFDNKGKLKYEGEYLYGQKWNGKGYDTNGDVIYELINGTGKIKEYYDNGQLKFESDYLNGKGKAKEYDYSGNLLFEGEYKNGERSGKGKAKGNKYNYKFHEYELEFEGEYLNGKKWNGKGKEEGGNGFIYEGEYLNGEITGKGTLFWVGIGILFDGEFLNGKRWNGKGREFLEDSKSFKMVFGGEYSKGKKNGNGREYYLNGKIKFDGDYLDSLKWNGKEYDANNDQIYEIKNGKGNIKEYDYSGLLIFEGEYLNGRKWNGNIYNNNDNKIYTLKDGKGFVKDIYKYLTDKDVKYFEGEYINGQRNGKGKKYFTFRTSLYLQFEGEFLNGKKHGKGKDYFLRKVIVEGEYSNGKVKKLNDELFIP